MKHIHSKEAMMLTKYPKELNPNWIIKQSTLGGRGLFAAKPIKKGTLILSNKPLVVAPRADCSGETYCSRCYKISDSCYPCDQCFSIICCEECQKSQEHKTECKFIKNNWKRKPNYDTYSDVLKLVQVYLRFLLLNEQQKDLLMELQRCIFKSNLKELELLCLKYIIPDDHLLFMEFVHSIMKLNSFRIAYNLNIKKIPLRGLYPLSSLLNHSCLPNTRSVFKEDYTMEVYAAKNIDIGEEILTCYTGILWCTPARRCQLYITKDFWCNCRRCEDSTEMGTNLSALKCYTKECVGVLLPKTSLDPNGVWFCDNCHSEVPATKISTVQSVLGSLVGSLDLDDQFRLDAPILARLASFIPCTNHIFIDIRLRLALRLGFSEALKLNELSESHLALKESLCRGSLRTLAALGVGDAHLRGLLLYHLHAALAERARRATHLYEELKAEIESTIEQAYNILQGDISAPPDLELRRRYLGPGCDKPQEERFFILDI